MTPAEERLREVTALGAAHGAAALAKLFDRVVAIDPPRCRMVGVAELAQSVFEPEEWVAGVFVHVSGSVRGRMGLVLSRDVLREILEHLEIADTGEFDDRVRSVVAELGNIAVSAAAGALGELEGGVAMPSVPFVGYDMAGALLVEALHPSLYRRPAFVAETDLGRLESRETDRGESDRGESDPRLHLRFLWVPEA